jgi:hypothetical protein
MSIDRIYGIQGKLCNQHAINLVTKLLEFKRYSLYRWNAGVEKSIQSCRDLHTTWATVESQKCAGGEAVLVWSKRWRVLLMYVLK